MLQDHDCYDTVCSGEVKAKLEVILTTLNMEAVSVKDFYHKKIS